MSRKMLIILSLLALFSMLSLPAATRTGCKPEPQCDDDQDGDGYGVGSNCLGPDCDDQNPDINPGADEICDDKIDNDCDTLTDQEDAADCPPPDCVDLDQDGYSVGQDCSGAIDCNDQNAAIHPGADEICDDSLDNDCDGKIDLNDTLDCIKQPRDFRDDTIYFLFTDRFVNGTTQNDNTDQGLLDDDEGYKTFDGDHGYKGGDFKGIIANLDYIQDLGFSALWITPIVDNVDYRYRSSDTSKLEESGYHGYWGKDFSKVDEHWESTGAKLEDLISEVHKRGMKIIVDVVPNHNSPAYSFKNNKEIPQFGEVWANGNKLYDHGPDPYATSWDTANWFHHDGPMTDYNDSHQLQFHDLEYLGDFNHENENTRNWLYDTYLFWQKKGIDGFRIDALKHMPRDYFLVPFAQKLLNAQSDFFMFGESFDGEPSNISYFTYTNEGKPSGISVLDFPNYFKSQGVFLAGASYAEMNWLLDRDSYYADASKLVTFVDNHDVNRFCGDANNLKDSLNWIYAVRGIPSVYFGTENQFKKCYDSKLGRAYFGNELGNAPSHDVYQHLKKLNSLRHSLKPLQKGSLERLPVQDAVNSFAFKRTYENLTIYIALNKSGNWANFSFGNVPDGQYKDQMSGNPLSVSNNTMIFGVSPHSMAIYVKNGL